MPLLDTSCNERSALQACHDQQAALAAFARHALQGRSIEMLLAEACRIAAERIGAGFSKILEYRPAHDDLVVRASLGWTSAIRGTLVQADHTNPSGEAFLTQFPVLVADLEQQPHYALPLLYSRHGIASAINVPITAKRQGEALHSFGVLEASSAHQCEFGAAETAFLTAIADILGEAIVQSREHAAIRHAQQASAALAAERQIHLREIQHRVRNDLQLVQNLAARHGRHADPASRPGFDAIGRRVLALAALYDHLLSVGMERRIDLGEYLASLCDKIRAAEDLAASGVELTAEVEPVELDFDTAAALGIAVNELVANAAEHAFDAQGGQVTVRLARNNDDNATHLTIADNGHGFHAGDAHASHGLKFVQHLVERAGAHLTCDHGPGTLWRITLPG